MTKMRRIPLIIAMLAALALPAAAQTGPTTLMLHFDMLPTLDETTDGHYEGWAIVGGAAYSTGKFNVNGNGQPIMLGGGDVIGEFDAGLDITGASDIKISLEAPGDMDALPSGLIVLTGQVNGLTANLMAALPGLDMLANMTTGAYILATPSDNDSDADNDDQGIWFLTMPNPDPGFLDLPDLGANWTYEGWVVDVSGTTPMPYSTGSFDMAAGFDSDAAGCMGGGPPFPGQDFVAYQCDGVLDLDSGDFAAVLSIEPVPDNSPAPFLFKPLAGMIPTDGLGNPGIPMNNQTTDTFPVGTALIAGATATEDASLSNIKSLW
jgi:hypothetical protein